MGNAAAFSPSDIRPAQSKRRTRIFTNGRSKLVAELQHDGSWNVSWVSSMGRRESTTFADDRQLDAWITTLGARNGYAEDLDGKQPNPHAVAERVDPAPRMSDREFDYLSRNVARWMREEAPMEIYAADGDDESYRLHFRTTFGLTLDEWDRELEARGMGVVVREDVVLAAIAEIERVCRGEAQA